MNMKLGMTALTAVAIMSLVTSLAQAQKKSRAVESHLAQSRGSGEDSRIKVDEAPNKKGASVALPAAKGGPKTRGAAVGVLHIDNRTSFFVRIYADGNYAGTVGPMGDLYFNGHCDSWELLAKVVYDDGSYATAGPVNAGSGCGGNIWTIRP